MSDRSTIKKLIDLIKSKQPMLPNDGSSTEFLAKDGLYHTINDEVMDTVTSSGADFAEIGTWKDGNPKKEDRLYRFVTIVGKNKEIEIANSKSQIIGTSNIKSNVGFLSGYTKGDEYNSAKVIVSIVGVAPIKTKDKAIVSGDMVMSDDYGYAVKSSNNQGYRVLSAKDNILTVVVSPNTDMLNRIKNDNVSTQHNIGDLQKLETSEKSSIVNAINNVYSERLTNLEIYELLNL